MPLSLALTLSMGLPSAPHRWSYASSLMPPLALLALPMSLRQMVKESTPVAAPFPGPMRESWIRFLPHLNSYQTAAIRCAGSPSPTTMDTPSRARLVSHLDHPAQVYRGREARGRVRAIFLQNSM